MSNKLSDPTLAPIVTDTEQAFDAATFEEQNVHEVYQNIASHFSETRYKPWPLVPEFLSTLPPGSVGADLGCGNGKYLHVRSILAAGSSTSPMPARDLITIGIDRSSNLVDLAQGCFPSATAAPSKKSKGKRRAEEQGEDLPAPTSTTLGTQRHEVAVSDALHSSLRSRAFDYAISIATIHHFATPARRENAAMEIIRLIRPRRRKHKVRDLQPREAEGDDSVPQSNLGNGTGRFMIYAWALEQRGESRRAFESVEAQDDAEAEEDRAAAERKQDLLVPWVLKASNEAKMTEESLSSDANDTESHAAPAVFQRYYHVFRSGELENLVEDAATKWKSSCTEAGQPIVQVELQASGWEKGNWWGVWNVFEEEGQI